MSHGDLVKNLGNLYPSKVDEDASLKGEMIAQVNHSEDVLTWRKSAFGLMGFSDTMAEFLAETHIDLRQTESMIAKGCSHTLAVDILLGTNFLGDDPNWVWGVDEAASVPS